MAGDKHFDATPARIARAKREGDVPRSQDLSALASFGCGALGVAVALPALAAEARAAFVQAAQTRSPGAGPYAAMAASALVPLGCALAGGVLSNLAQAGGVTLRWPGFRLAKLQPFEGLRRMLSRDALVSAAKTVLVGSAVTAAIVPAVTSAFVAAGSHGDVASLGRSASGALCWVVASALGVAALFAAGDVLLERAKWRRRLRMDARELKADQKENEGDPATRGRRRRAHRAIVRGSLARVKDAAFVVTNPTHIAIALEYAPPRVAVPRVLVRAADEGAARVKALARRHRIPIVENVAVARLLFASTEPAAFIPRELYVPVAQIVAAVVRAQAER